MEGIRREKYLKGLFSELQDESEILEAIKAIDQAPFIPLSFNSQFSFFLFLFAIFCCRLQATATI